MLLPWFKSTAKAGCAICISSEKLDATRGGGGRGEKKNKKKFVSPGTIVCRSLVVQTHPR